MCLQVLHSHGRGTAPYIWRIARVIVHGYIVSQVVVVIAPSYYIFHLPCQSPEKFLEDFWGWLPSPERTVKFKMIEIIIFYIIINAEFHYKAWTASYSKAHIQHTSASKSLFRVVLLNSFTFMFFQTFTQLLCFENFRADSISDPISNLTQISKTHFVEILPQSHMNSSWFCLNDITFVNYMRSN